MRFSFLAATLVLLSGVTATHSAAQPINIQTPLNSVSDSYFESFGINFGFSLPGGRGPGSRVEGLNSLGQITPNLHFSQGGMFGAQPAFGGFRPNAGARFGFGSSGPNGGYSLGLHLAKGSNRQSITTAPHLTVMNGASGSIFSGSVRPFVTATVPIVGHRQPEVDNAVTRALRGGQLSFESSMPPDSSVNRNLQPNYNSGSTATMGDRSVKSIKAQRERELALAREALERKLAEAHQLVDAEELSVARTRFREALRLTDDEQVKQQIKAWISATRK